MGGREAARSRDPHARLAASLRRQVREFGGSWIYPQGDNRVSIGFVVGLDYTDATVSASRHPAAVQDPKLVRGILDGGKRVAWGAKAIPEGGYWAMPKPSAPGMVVCGDSAGMVNVPILKGIHYAIHSGIMAAETIFKRSKGGGTNLSEYDQRVEDSLIGKELYESRNMRQPFARGFFVGGAITNAMVITKGRFPGGRWPITATPTRAWRSATREGQLSEARRQVHVRQALVGVCRRATPRATTPPTTSACSKRVPREIAETWQYMCPAGVYEIPDDAPDDGRVST